MKGLVYKSTGSWYTVKSQEGDFYNCRIKGRFRIKGIKSTNPVAVGDHVSFEVETKGDETIGIIDGIDSRYNYIVRKSVNLSKQTHIIAANIDVAFLLVTLNNPPTFTTFIDRFLVTAEAYHIKAVLLFNKIDTCSEDDLEYIDALAHMYERIGYPTHKISATNKENIDFLKEEINNKQVMISGHSGVGKSTLVNSLDPTFQLKIGEISKAHKQGQHTTTFAEMHKLASGGYIIDTPGIRAFGVVDLDKAVISHYFPEMRAILADCKFNNCQHINEPKCAVKEAVETGEIDESRYATYMQLMEEDANDIHRKNIYG